jgi:DNA-binding protein HU-beta
MTKAEIITEIASKTGVEKVAVQAVVESFMETVKDTMVNGENVYLRGFGSFIIKKRAEKTGRNISKNTTIIIPAHNIPAFKPAKTFVNEVKSN